MAENYRPSLDDPNQWVPYRYHPSLTTAAIFLALFGLTTLLHVYQLCRRRTWYFIPLIVGGIFEVVGFSGRILSAEDLWALGPFIMQSLLLLIAPALFAASIYIILGRIILLVDGERFSIIRQRWLTKIFVTGDVISFCVQGLGGGIQAAGTLELLHAGEKIIIVGLFIQITFFSIFVVVAGMFHYRLAKANPSPPKFDCMSRSQRLTASSSTSLHSHTGLEINGLPWKRHIFALYITSALIMVRSIFRVIEYLQGNNGYLLRHEVFLYVFDGALMLVVMCVFNYIHPAEVTELHQRRLSEREIGHELNERGEQQA